MFEDFEDDAEDMYSEPEEAHRGPLKRGSRKVEKQARAPKGEKRRRNFDGLSLARNKYLRLAILLVIVLFTLGLLNTVFWSGKAQMINLGKYGQHKYVNLVLAMDSDLKDLDQKMKDAAKKYEKSQVSSTYLQDLYKSSCDKFTLMVAQLNEMDKDSKVPEVFSRGANFHATFTDVIKLRYQSADGVLNYFAGGDDSNLATADESLRVYSDNHDKVMSLFYQIVSENKL